MNRTTLQERLHQLVPSEVERIVMDRDRYRSALEEIRWNPHLTSLKEARVIAHDALGQEEPPAEWRRK